MEYAFTAAKAIIYKEIFWIQKSYLQRSENRKLGSAIFVLEMSFTIRKWPELKSACNTRKYNYSCLRHSQVKLLKKFLPILYDKSKLVQLVYWKKSVQHELSKLTFYWISRKYFHSLYFNFWKCIWCNMQNNHKENFNILYDTEKYCHIVRKWKEAS